MGGGGGGVKEIIEEQAWREGVEIWIMTSSEVVVEEAGNETGDEAMWRARQARRQARQATM